MRALESSRAGGWWGQAAKEKGPWESRARVEGFPDTGLGTLRPASLGSTNPARSATWAWGGRRGTLRASPGRGKQGGPSPARSFRCEPPESLSWGQLWPDVQVRHPPEGTRAQLDPGWAVLGQPAAPPSQLQVQVRACWSMHVSPGYVHLWPAGQALSTLVFPLCRGPPFLATISGASSPAPQAQISPFARRGGRRGGGRFPSSPLPWTGPLPPHPSSSHPPTAPPPDSLGWFGKHLDREGGRGMGAEGGG